jgi:hypothetical protein
VPTSLFLNPLRRLATAAGLLATEMGRTGRHSFRAPSWGSPMLNPRAHFVVASLVAIVAGGAFSAHAEAYDYATTTGYAALTSGTTASATLQGNAVTINTGTRGGGITLGTAKQITFAGETPLTNLSNPEWIAGTRSFFDVTYHRSTTPDSSVAMEILFSQPLPALSYLVFVDFDAREVLNIKAYDQSSNLIANGVLTFSRQNGNTADGALLAYPTWNTLGGYTGSLVTGTFATTPEPVVSLQTSVGISRLEYEFDMNPTGSVTRNDVQFNFAVSVPEPSTYAMALAGLACGGFSMWRRRKRA